MFERLTSVDQYEKSKLKDLTASLEPWVIFGFVMTAKKILH